MEQEEHRRRYLSEMSVLKVFPSGEKVALGAVHTETLANAVQRRKYMNFSVKIEDNCLLIEQETKENERNL